MSIQQELSALRSSATDSAWFDQPNKWLRDLSGPRLSDTATRLVASLTHGTQIRKRSTPYKVEADGMHIDVKVATLSEINGISAFGWRNIRDMDKLSHLALLAIFPATARLFLLPICGIPPDQLKGTNVSGEFQIVLTWADALPLWLERHEFHAIPAP